MPLHKPVFYTRKETTDTHVFHNCDGGINFISSDVVDDKTAYLINLAIEEGKRQKAAEIRDVLGMSR